MTNRQDSPLSLVDLALPRCAASSGSRSQNQRRTEEDICASVRSALALDNLDFAISEACCGALIGYNGPALQELRCEILTRLATNPFRRPENLAFFAPAMADFEL